MTIIEEEKRSIEKCLGNIYGAFNPKEECLGNDWSISFDEKAIISFVTSLPFKTREQLSGLLAFFIFRMRPLYKLNIKDGTVNDALGPQAWSDFSLVVIMSVLDKYTKGSFERTEFTDFLIQNLPIDSKEKAHSLSMKHKDLSSMPNRLTFLFTESLEVDEVNEIVQRYMLEQQLSGDIKINSIENVFKHLWGKVRSGFIHETGEKFFYNEAHLFNLLSPVSNSLSMSNFLFLSWKAIFRSLGYVGKMEAVFPDNIPVIINQ